MSAKRHDAYMATLERDNEALRQRVEALEAELAKHAFSPESMVMTPSKQFGLTDREGRTFARIATSGFATKEQLLEAVTLPGKPPPIYKIVDVYVCKVRKKVERFGIVIETAHGRGYKIGPESMALIAAIQSGTASTHAS